MLARLAENLFWAGRYVERAEDTARMVDVTFHTLLESPRGRDTQSWEQLLDVLHLRPIYGNGPVEPERTIEFLVVDRENPGSITACITRARENVRSVRELVSSELWESVNELHLALLSRDMATEVRDQPSMLLRTILRNCATIYGVASETMPRDDVWRFMALGRLLERAEMTCRLIDVRYGQLEGLAEPPTDQTAASGETAIGTGRADFHHWTAVLKSASALEAYRRRYRSSMNPVDVVEFLLLEPDLPRSVLFTLTGAMAQLNALSEGHASIATRRLGRATSSLQYRDVSELFDVGLHTFLSEMQDQVAGVAEAVAVEFFRNQPAGAMHAIASG